MSVGHTLWAQDATGLADMVRKGEVSPIELTEAAIARAEATRSDINATAEPLYEAARARAKTIDRSLPLAGVAAGCAAGAASAFCICVSSAFPVCADRFRVKASMRFTAAGSSSCKLKSRLLFVPAPTKSFFAGAKPNMETSSVQVPGPREGNPKCPFWSVTVVFLLFP